MPTYQRLPRFHHDGLSLRRAEQKRFHVAVAGFVEDTEAGRPFRPGLWVKAVQGTGNIMETKFAPDGRATWQFGAEVKLGQLNGIWRRIGTDDIFRSP